MIKKNKIIRWKKIQIRLVYKKKSDKNRIKENNK